jgi:uncharacterized membrane protein
MSTPARFHPWKSRFWIIIGFLLAGLLAVWLTFTPAGFSGKLQAVGYAVCQQDPAHTLNLGGRLLPLCSRCTGMYLGALVAMAALLGQGKARLAPSKGKMIVLAVLVLTFAIDGINSTLAEFAPTYMLYVPGNTLRLITGMSMGMVIANVLLPLWNQTFWAEGLDEPVLKSWSQLAWLILLETAAGILVLTGMQWLYFPVAVLTTGMVSVLLTMIYTLLWMVFLKRENLIRHWKEGILYLGIGAISMLVQIGLFDLIRFLLTRSWQGFPF